MNAFGTELREQPDALRALTAYYCGGAGEAQLAALRGMPAPLLTGMGASYHASLAMAPYFHYLGVNATVVEATELLNYHSDALADAARLVYLSQSGMSGEIAPLVARLSRKTVEWARSDTTTVYVGNPTTDTTLIGITNDPDSLLGRAAAVTLPLHAGDETFVACKTYINSLALLWLLARAVSGAWDGSERETLAGIADRLAALIAHEPVTATQWLDALADAPRLVFMGHGPHAATARQAAMMAAEWAKHLVLFTSIGAFRHGFIEVIQPGDGVVLFAPPGPSHASAHTLAQELAGYDVRVLLVEHGATYTPDETPTLAGTRADAEYLAPLLDIIPAQLFVHALAAHRAILPGFRYIAKVTTAL